MDPNSNSQSNDQPEAPDAASAPPVTPTSQPAEDVSTSAPEATQPVTTPDVASTPMVDNSVPSSEAAPQPVVAEAPHVKHSRGPLVTVFIVVVAVAALGVAAYLLLA